MTPLKPICSATSDQCTNSSGLTHRSMGWCSLEGRRYCVIVRMSQPAWCRSRMASSISLSVSPIPRMRLDFVTSSAARAMVSTLSDFSYVNAGRILLKMRGTVSRLWAKTSGRASKTCPTSSGLAPKSGGRISTPVLGLSRWIWRIVSA